MNDSLEQWRRQTYDPVVARRAERRPEFRRSSGDPLQPLYDAPADSAQLGFPGEFPYTRGIQPSMYRGRFWTMRQYAGQEDAEASNRRYRFLLAQGQTGLSVAFDLPTPDRLRLRRPRGDRRGGQGGRGDRLHRRYAHPLRRHPPRPRHHLHDDQCHGRHAPRPLRRGRPRAGRRARHPRGAPSRTTSSRSTWRAAPSSIRRAPPCA